jgi:hypothetical protein
VLTFLEINLPFETSVGNVTLVNTKSVTFAINDADFRYNKKAGRNGI